MNSFKEKKEDAYKNWEKQRDLESQAWSDYRALVLKEIEEAYSLKKGVSEIIYKGRTYIYCNLYWREWRSSNFIVCGWLKSAQESSKYILDPIKIGPSVFNLSNFEIKNLV